MESVELLAVLMNRSPKRLSERLGERSVQACGGTAASSTPRCCGDPPRSPTPPRTPDTPGRPSSRSSAAARRGTRRNGRHCLERHTPQQNTARGPASGVSQSPQPGQRRTGAGPLNPAINPDTAESHAPGLARPDDAPDRRPCAPRSARCTSRRRSSPPAAQAWVAAPRLPHPAALAPHASPRREQPRLPSPSVRPLRQTGPTNRGLLGVSAADSLGRASGRCR